MRSILAALALCLALAAPAFAGSPVDINRADAQTLADALDGIGLAKAKAIVDYRQTRGPFKSADQLTEVKGIGARTVERNRANILLNGAHPAAVVAKPATKTVPATRK